MNTGGGGLDGGQQVQQVSQWAIVPYDSGGKPSTVNPIAAAAAGAAGKRTNGEITFEGSGSTSSGSWGSDWGTRKGNNGFVGLSNQGATCYLNSLLQTLYMTPEFRASLYRWKYEGEDDGDCIPYQLQRLFGMLQLTSMGSVETTALTKSFGWGAADAFQQHDVQELCRVLFDALEVVMAGTPHATLVNDLYQGRMIDYVRCKECGKETTREDSFLDLSLVLRPFGSKTVMSSVEESLDYFLKPEILEGDNKYMCEACNKKCDAVKGLKLAKLPYLLSLQLKRFDYDFTTFARIKLNDEVRFPLLLDLNRYMVPQMGSNGGLDSSLGTSNQSACGASKLEGAGAEGVLPLPDLVDGKGIKAPDQLREEADAAMTPEEISFQTAWEPETVVKERGPYCYELYAVLIHSGSAMGGHYYAYIRSLADGQFYNFNDSSVSKVDVATVKRAWGGAWASDLNAGVNGTRTAYKSASTYGANAYMLMYRRIEPGRNTTLPQDGEVPENVRDWVKKEEERVAKAKVEREERMDQIRLKCHSVQHPSGHDVEISRKVTLRKLREVLHVQMGFEKEGLPLDCLRIREYTTHYSANFPCSEALTDDEATLEQLRFVSYKHILVESRQQGQDWPPIKDDVLKLHIRRYNHTTKTLGSAELHYVPPDTTVAQLLAKLASQWGIDASQKNRSRLGLGKSGPDYYTKQIQILAEEDKPLSSLNLMGQQQHHIYVDVVDEDELLTEEREHAMEEALQLEGNLLRLKTTFIATEDELQKIYHKTKETEAVVEKSIAVDRRRPVSMLRDTIASVLGLPAGSFKVMVLKGNGISEIRGTNTAINGLQPAMFEDEVLYAVPGEPLKDGEHVVKFALLRTPYPAGAHHRPIRPRCARCCVRAEREAEGVRGRISDSGEGDGVMMDVDNPEVGDGPAAVAPTAEGPTCEGVELSVDPVAPTTNGCADEGSTPSSPRSLQEADGFGPVTVETLPPEDAYEHKLSLVVHESITIAEIRSKVASELRSQGCLPADASVDCVRLRDKTKLRPTRLLRDNETLRDLTKHRVTDVLELALQILPEPERVHELLGVSSGGPKVVVVQWFCRKCHAFGARFESFFLETNFNATSAARLADQLGVADPTKIRIMSWSWRTMVPVVGLGRKDPLQGKSWLDPNLGTGVFINDGDFVMCMDESEPLRELTEEERAAIENAAKAINKPGTSCSFGATTGGNVGGGYVWKRPAEKGVRIRTKNERQKEQEVAAAAAEAGKNADQAALNVHKGPIKEFLTAGPVMASAAGERQKSEDVHDAEIEVPLAKPVRGLFEDLESEAEASAAGMGL